MIHSGERNTWCARRTTGAARSDLRRVCPPRHQTPHHTVLCCHVVGHVDRQGSPAGDDNTTRVIPSGLHRATRSPLETAGRRCIASLAPTRLSFVVSGLTNFSHADLRCVRWEGIHRFGRLAGAHLCTKLSGGVVFKPTRGDHRAPMPTTTTSTKSLSALTTWARAGGDTRATWTGGVDAPCW